MLNTLFGQSNGPFQPGVFNNSDPSKFGFQALSSAYKPSKRNLAPNIGVAWSPNGGDGILGRFLGRGKTVIAASYGISYYNEGMSAISQSTSNNPSSVVQTRNAAAALAANPGAYNLSSPIPPYASNPTSYTDTILLAGFPTNGGSTGSWVSPNQKTPYVQSWNFRFQREVARGTVLEVRYIGTHSIHEWHDYQPNETNIFENGFLPQFLQAQKNLSINAANGVANNFSNKGFAGQAAIPIFETAFGANGSQAALSTSSGFGSSTFINYLNQGNVVSLAGSLASTGTGTYFCRLVGANFSPCVTQGYTAATAYPSNFFQPNPWVGGLYAMDDDAYSNYNGLQLHLRKSTSHGLTLDASYTWSHTLGILSGTPDAGADTQYLTLRDKRMNYASTSFDRRHAMILYWTYDLPVGKGKWLNTNNRIANGVFGGWTIGESTVIQSGTPQTVSGGRTTFNNFADGGVVFGNGMTLQQLLQRTSKIVGNYVASCNCYKTDVSDIIQVNGSVNPQYYAPNTAPGVLLPQVWYTGKTSYALNLSLVKKFRINERTTLGFWGGANNFLNHPFFPQGTISTTSTSFGNITSASGNRTIQLRAYLDF